MPLSLLRQLFSSTLVFYSFVQLLEILGDRHEKEDSNISH